MSASVSKMSASRFLLPRGYSIRQSPDSLSFNMAIPIHGKVVFILYWDGAQVQVVHASAFMCMGSYATGLVHSNLEWHLAQGSGLLTQRDKMDDISQTFLNAFFNENVWILVKFSLKFVVKSPINNIPAFLQIMARRHPGDKPSS